MLWHFYKAEEDVVWVTFHQHALWWCYSKQEVAPEPDNSKVRHVVGAWSNQDVNGRPILMSSLPGTVLMMEGFKGTICKVNEWKYILRRIKGEESDGVVSARKSFELLTDSLETLIKNLSWQDFEILVDLIFRQAGWQRVGVVGKTTKSWDLDLLSPATNERGLVQVKSESTQEELRKHLRDFAETQGYARMFYVVHGGMGEGLKEPIADGRVRVLVARDVADLAINSGLTQWVMGKSL